MTNKPNEGLLNPVRQSKKAAMKKAGIKSGKTWRRIVKRIRREKKENIS